MNITMLNVHVLYTITTNFELARQNPITVENPYSCHHWDQVYRPD